MEKNKQIAIGRLEYQVTRSEKSSISNHLLRDMKEYSAELVGWNLEAGRVSWKHPVRNHGHRDTMNFPNIGNVADAPFN